VTARFSDFNPNSRFGRSKNFNPRLWLKENKKHGLS